MKPNFLLTLCGLLFVASCATTPEPVVIERPQEIQLVKAVHEKNPALNVSIVVFGKGQGNPALRSAEADYLPSVLRETLIESGHWGAVRVVPRYDPTAEVLVTGEIRSSNGVDLELHIKAGDSTGRIWIDKDYSDFATDHGYDFDEQYQIEPFKDLFNLIANDMLEIRESLEANQLSRVLDTAMLRYAVELSPDVFERYLVKNEDGTVEVSGLPARTDPMYSRARKIRDSEYKFIDIVDEQYENFYKSMRETYGYWRRYSYELTEYNEKIEQNGSKRKRSRESVWVAMDDVYRTYKESKMNEDALRELASSFDSEITPIVTELEGTVVKLNGTLEAQYEDWRKLLRQIYQEETGS
jgi:hypothetical protein